MMVLENKRMDITDLVVAKFEQNHLNLYVENESIGRLVFLNNGREYELKNGYVQENDRFYKNVSVTANPDQKYVDCDNENGWC